MDADRDRTRRPWCRRTALALALAAGVGLGPGPAAAQTAGALPADDGFRVVETHVDGDGDVVATVAVPNRLRSQPPAASTLRVVADGAPIDATIAAVAPDGIGVAVLLDDARGVDEASLVAQQGVVAELLIQLDARTPVVLASTSNGVIEGPTADRTVLLQALKQVPPGDERDAVGNATAALDALGAVAGGPRGLAVLTLGPDAGSSAGGAGAAALAVRLEAAGTLTRWIDFSARGTAVPEPLADQGATAVLTPAAVLPILDQFAADLGGQYRVELPSPTPGSNVSIELAAAGERFAAPLTLPSPAPAPTPAATAATAAAPATTAAPAGAADPAPAAAASASAPSEGTSDDGPPIGLIVSGIALALAALVGAVLLRRSRRTAPANEPIRTQTVAAPTPPLVSAPTTVATAAPRPAIAPPPPAPAAVTAPAQSPVAEPTHAASTAPAPEPSLVAVPILAAAPPAPTPAPEPAPVSAPAADAPLAPTPAADPAVVVAPTPTAAADASQPPAPAAAAPTPSPAPVAAMAPPVPVATAASGVDRNGGRRTTWGADGVTTAPRPPGSTRARPSHPKAKAHARPAGALKAPSSAHRSASSPTKTRTGGTSGSRGGLGSNATVPPTQLATSAPPAPPTPPPVDDGSGAVPAAHAPALTRSPLPPPGGRRGWNPRPLPGVPASRPANRAGTPARLPVAPPPLKARHASVSARRTNPSPVAPPPAPTAVVPEPSNGTAPSPTAAVETPTPAPEATTSARPVGGYRQRRGGGVKPDSHARPSGGYRVP